MISQKELLSGYLDAVSKLHDEYNKNFPEKCFYHYTSTDGFKKIVGNKKIRFTHFKDLDDKQEIKSGERCIKKLVDDFNVISNWTRSFWRKTKSLNTVNLVEIVDVYTASFCKVIDYSHCWNKYADSGKGLCISFNKDVFSENESHKENEIGIVKIEVSYKEENFLRLVEKILSCTDDFLINNKEMNRKNLTNGLIANLLSLYPGLKGDSFSDEKELRLYLMKFKGEPGWFPEKIKFERNGVKKKGIKVEFSRNDINEIWIGPNCDLSEKEIVCFLNSCDYEANKIKIQRSKITS